VDTLAPHTPLTIFIVEDNPFDVSMMRWVLDAAVYLHTADNYRRLICRPSKGQKGL
jgi:hypothetical protein